MVSKSSVGVLTYLVTCGFLLCGFIIPATGIDCVCFTKIVDSLRNPVQLIQNTGESDIFLIAQQNGIIVEYSSPDMVRGSTFINITSVVNYEQTHMDERGLLSFALHPNYKSNGRIFIYYIKRIGEKEFAMISELRITTDKTRIETVLFAIEQFAERRNGGQVRYTITVSW